jgi:predicted DsbA family dithiol-disulfide isomerase
LKVTHYIDVLSSWCLIAEDGLARLRATHGAALDYEWRIAWVKDGGPAAYSREQLAWYYGRTAAVTGVRLVPWVENSTSSTAPANLAAEAARALGVTDERVRLALARAAMLEGRPLGRREVAIEVAAAAGSLDPRALDAKMNDPKIERILRENAATFAGLAAHGVDQRPTFVFENTVGDRVILSGVWRHEPLAATAAGLLADEGAYARFAATTAPYPA